MSEECLALSYGWPAKIIDNIPLMSPLDKEDIQKGATYCGQLCHICHSTEIAVFWTDIINAGWGLLYRLDYYFK